jgi:Holliday junction resolvase-like predicted endonuclease
VLESGIQTRIIQAIRKRYGADVIVTNYHGGIYSASGTFDLIICFRGMYVEMEVKRPKSKSNPGGEMSAIQISRIPKLEYAGAKWCVVHSPSEAIAFLDSCRKEVLI